MLFALFSLFYSCRFYQKEWREEDLKGEWHFVDYIDIDNQNDSFLDFIVNINKLDCYFFEGSGKLIRDQLMNTDYPSLISPFAFIGDTVEYLVNDGVLKVYNELDGYLEFYQILALTQDSLFLKKDNFVYKFAKQKIDEKRLLDFDAIVYSAEDCCGNCPIINLMVCSNGDVYYYGELNGRYSGAFRSNITEEDYTALKQVFNNADLSNLAIYYNSGGIGPPVISVTFMKEGKRVKTIEDCGEDAPVHFVRAYKLMANLENKLIMSPWKVNLDFFETLQRKITLSRSEAFGLFVYSIISKDKK